MDPSLYTTPFLSGGRYEIIAALGEGGMAYVFKAFDTRLKVERAIKILAPRLMMHRQIRERFEVEASTMAQLHHKHIVTVHDIGNEQNLVYMVMEMLPGGSLKDRIDDHGVLHPQQAVDAAISMASGLGYAHEHNVVHRDVKLDNVLISAQGVMKVADFGIARIDDGNTGMTQTGAVMGTLAYMAPEQRLSARRAGPQADLYAVAASFYVMISNRNPIELYSEDMQADAFADLSEPVIEFLKKGCHFNPSERFKDADDLIAALESLRSDLPPMPDDVNPIYVPRVKVSNKPTEKDITTLHTMWNTLIDEDNTGTFVRPQAYKASPVQQTSNTLMDIDLMGDTEADYMDPDPSVVQDLPTQVDAGQQSNLSQTSSNTAETKPEIPDLPDLPEAKSGGFGKIIAALAVVGLIVGGIFSSGVLDQKPQGKSTVEAPDTNLVVAKVEAKNLLKELDTYQSKGIVIQADVKTGLESSIEDAQSKADVDAVMSKIKAQITAAKEQVAKAEKADAEAKAKAEAEAKAKAEAEAKANKNKNTNRSTKTTKDTRKDPAPTKDPTPPVSNVKADFMVNSIPWSSVSINGQTQNSPFKGKLPVGSYNVILKRNDGTIKRTKINIREGKSNKYCWNFLKETEC